MSRFGSHQNHENRSYTKDSLLRASPKHEGRVFFE